MSAIETALAALYLRGLARPAEPNPRGWPQVVSLLRKSSQSPAETLNAHGFTLEALALQGSAWQQAERLVEAGLVLTAASQFYPKRWVERLGPAAPPALYARGNLSLLHLPALAVVGSRKPPSNLYRLARQFSQIACEAGYVVVSGGAPGIDRAVAGAKSVIELWPCGLACSWSTRQQKLALSLWPPREPFSAAGAMERNNLIYALAEAAYLGHARFKQGGTWHGATDAARKKLTRLLVSAQPWDEEGEPARKAFLGLGAATLENPRPEALQTALSAQPLQPWLPGFSPTPESGQALTVW